MSKAKRWRSAQILWLCLFLTCSPATWPAETEPLEIEGVDKALAENIRLNLPAPAKLRQQSRKLMRQRLQGPATRALQAFGYYRATVEVRFNNGRPSLHITPGPAVTWGHIDIRSLANGRDAEPEMAGSNEADPALAKFIASHPFQPDAPMNHATYDNFKRDYLAQARARGYLDAALTRHELRIDLTRYRADVVLELRHGDAYRLGAIAFTGSDLSAPLLHHLSGLNSGDRYDANHIGDAYNQLLNSGYFAAVAIDTQPQPPNQIDLTVKLQDAPTHRFTTGAGYGTDTGPRVQFGWQRPRVNRRGDSLQTRLQISAVSQSLSTEYRIPWHHPLIRYLSWQSGWQKKQVEDTDTRIVTTGLAYNNLATTGWQHTYQVDLERETYAQGSQATETVTYVIPSGSWTRTVISGEARNPDWGFRLWLGLQASSTLLGSDTDFVRLTAGLRHLYRLSVNYQLIARISGGAIYSGDFLDVPASRRFFTGGDQTVRGFAFESLSPQDAAGELTGGQRLNTASLELRRQWRPNWQWAFFVDSGRAYNDSAESFHTGAGFGLRWQSPVGTLALDLAKPVDSDRSDSLRLHLYMGLPL